MESKPRAFILQLRFLGLTSVLFLRVDSNTDAWKTAIPSSHIPHRHEANQNHPLALLFPQIVNKICHLSFWRGRKCNLSCECDQGVVYKIALLSYYFPGALCPGLVGVLAICPLSVSLDGQFAVTLTRKWQMFKGDHSSSRMRLKSHNFNKKDEDRR